MNRMDLVATAMAKAAYEKQPNVYGKDGKPVTWRYLVHAWPGLVLDRREQMKAALFELMNMKQLMLDVLVQYEHFVKSADPERALANALYWVLMKGASDGKEKDKG